MIGHAGRRDLIAAGLAGAIALYIVYTGDRFDPILLWSVAAFNTLMLIWIAWQDVKTFSLPDGASVGIFLIGSALRLSQPQQDVSAESLAIALDILFCAGTLLIVRELFFRLKGIDGLGFGDIKLAAASAALLGTVDFAIALFIASAAGCLFAVGARLVSKRQLAERLPFGAFLAPACGLVWVISPAAI